MTRVKNRKNIVVASGLPGNGNPFNWNQNIYIPFQPDEVIIKQFILDNGIATGPYTVSTDLINDQILLIVEDQKSATATLTMTSVDIRHKITVPIQGSFHFTINTAPTLSNTTSGNLVPGGVINAGTNAAQFMMMLEFIEYYAT